MKTDEPGVLFGLSLKVTIALVLILISLAVILLYIFIPSARGQIAFATAVVGGAAVVYAGYYAGVSVKLAREQAKKEHSFGMLETLNCLDMAGVRVLIENEVSNKDISPTDLYQKIIGDTELLRSIMSVFGFWEDISVGIQFGYLDEEVLFYSLSFLIPWHFDSLKHYIDEERQRINNPHLYIEMGKLADAWKNDKSLLTGETYTWD